MAHDELGVRAVRAHAILHDDLGVYREVDGQPVIDFAGIDRIYDRVLELGLRPIVEISFMPRDLASDPDRTVFHYGAIVSPPKDWNRWEQLVGDFTAHLVERYGRDEVRTWGFEVWNEANLEVFWSGTRDEYLRLYDVSVRAVKAVDAALPVGGPASAAAAWIDELLVHVNRSSAPDRLPLDAHLRKRPVGPAPGRRPPWPPRPAPVVDRVGCPCHPFQPGSRLGVERRLPHPRHGRARWDASTLSPTGRSPTTSRSSEGRRSCSTAGSACSPSATCASRGGGRCGCSNSFGTNVWRSKSRATEPATWSTPSAAPIRMERWRSWCGTGPSTSPSPAATSFSTARSSSRLSDLSAPAYRVRHRRARRAALQPQRHLGPSIGRPTVAG